MKATIELPDGSKQTLNNVSSAEEHDDTGNVSVTFEGPDGGRYGKAQFVDARIIGVTKDE